jgi:hypothetical protein
MVEATGELGSMLNLILILCKKLQNAGARGVVQKGLEAFEDCNARRWLYVAIEV